MIAVGVLVVAAVVAIVLAVVSGGGRSGDPVHGRALYGQYCVSCHGPDGRGEPGWRRLERAAPALDITGHAWHHEDAQLIQMILDKPLPDSKMPPWRGVLSRDDAIDMLAFIKSLWTPFIRDNCQGARHMACMNR